MRRLILYHHTGKNASDLKVAARIVKKLKGAHCARRCLLVDCERVVVAPEFLAILIDGSLSAHIRFCGLPIHMQEFIRTHQKGGKS